MTTELEPTNDERARRDAQDHRVRFDAATAAPEPLRRAILAMIRARLGWPALAISQDETVILDELTAAPPGWCARFTYVLDRDFCSQYDQTTRTSGTITLAADGTQVATGWADEPSPPS